MVRIAALAAELLESILPGQASRTSAAGIVRGQEMVTRISGPHRGLCQRLLQCV